MDKMRTEKDRRAVPKIFFDRVSGAKTEMWPFLFGRTAAALHIPEL
jgi:hypothetical protein